MESQIILIRICIVAMVLMGLYIVFYPIEKTEVKYQYKTNYDSCQLVGFIDGVPLYDCPTKLDTIR